MATSTEEESRPLIQIRDRGRVTIPKEIREQFDTKYFRISRTDGGNIELEPAHP